VKRNDKWYVCDDDDIKEIDESKILVDSAYLLFYRMDEETQDN
jgi:ubiquitin C-terminal hydrolase